MKTYKSFRNYAIMSAIILLLLIALPTSPAFAYTAGPNDAGVGSNVTGIGNSEWQDPGNITDPGSPYATITLYQNRGYSNYLQGTQYGFDIPADAHIDGITVNINRMSNANNPSILDNVVSLVKDGTITGDNKASLNIWPLSMEVGTYGGATDLWGNSWTPADINSPDFGVVLAAYRQNHGNNQRTSSVDYMQIIIYYTYSTSMTVDCGDGTPVIDYGDTITCVATVTRLAGTTTPTGTVDWTTDGSGFFDPNPCTLFGSDGISTCSADYTPSDVGTALHLVTAAYSGDEYFTPNSASEIVVVMQRPVTVTADTQSKAYGDAEPELTYQITDGSLVFNDTFTGSLAREPGEEVGHYAILQNTLALSDNYILTYIGSDLTITLRPITVVADAKTKVYAQPDPELTFQITYGSLLPGDSFSGELTRQPGENIGTYAILQGTLSLPDYYEITYVGSNLTIIGFSYFYPMVLKYYP